MYDGMVSKGVVPPVLATPPCEALITGLFFFAMRRGTTALLLVYLARTTVVAIGFFVKEVCYRLMLKLCKVESLFMFSLLAEAELRLLMGSAVRPSGPLVPIKLSLWLRLLWPPIILSLYLGALIETMDAVSDPGTVAAGLIMDSIRLQEVETKLGLLALTVLGSPLTAYTLTSYAALVCFFVTIFWATLSSLLA